MLARKYSKPIAIWQTTNVNDGYGGKTVNTSLLRTVWAHVTTKNATRLNENGQNDNLQKTVFVIRYNSNFNLSVKNNFIKYNGKIYDIDGIVEVELNNVDLEITTTQRT